MHSNIFVSSPALLYLYYSNMVSDDKITILVECKMKNEGRPYPVVLQVPAP
jgi:hypothetical protein